MGETTVSELLARSMVPGESLGLSSRGGRDKINIVNKVYQDTDLLSIYLSTDLSIYLSIYPYIYLYIYISIYISIYLSIYLPFYLSLYLSIYLSIYISFYLYIYLSLEEYGYNITSVKFI